MRAPIAPPPEMADCGAGRAIRARAARALQSLTCPWVGGYATNHADYDDAAALLSTPYPPYPLHRVPRSTLPLLYPRGPLCAVLGRKGERKEGRKKGRNEHSCYYNRAPTTTSILQRLPRPTITTTTTTRLRLLLYYLYYHTTKTSTITTTTTTTTTMTMMTTYYNYNYDDDDYSTTTTPTPTPTPTRASTRAREKGE